MADNTQLPSGSGGDTIRDKDRSGIKTQIVGLDLSPGSGSETLMTGKMPATIADGDAAPIGATGDGTWSGSGSGSAIAILKAIYSTAAVTCSIARLASSAATTNATSVKASAGTVYGIHVLNTNSSVRYVHLYNKASAPTVGTDTPILTVPVPPSNGGIARPFTAGVAFTTGIAYSMTTDAAAGNNAVASGDLVGLAIDYS